MEIKTQEFTNTTNYKETVLADYRLAYMSREASLIGRREVLTGKAKFGIFGDGKELPQIAMAKVFRKGDIRSGYYRDQTFAFSKGIQNIKSFFAQLYADPNLEADPNSGGRQMNAHFASRNIDEAGKWNDLTQLYNSYADASPTASQMPRLVGLVQASKLYRLLPELSEMKQFSNNGEEVVFGTIGNASCAEGHFWEAINAVGVIQGPLVMSIWDDDYGISVPNTYQITKSSLSEMLSGFQRTETERGFEIFTVKAWDYEALIKVYEKAAQLARAFHIPSIVHVTEVTQPQGHSTSGSHERYKTKERLQWEKDFDCNLKLKEYILKNKLATEEEIKELESDAKKEVRKLKKEAWTEFLAPIKRMRSDLAAIIEPIIAKIGNPALQELLNKLNKEEAPKRRDVVVTAHRVLLLTRNYQIPERAELLRWYRNQQETGDMIYSSHLYSESEESPLNVKAVYPEFGEEGLKKSGFEILNTAFDKLFGDDPRLVAFGEDVGNLGDVNQGFAGLQKKYGLNRVMDTGIREATIIGQALGLSARGLRPIAEIQYLDYFIYGLQTLSDDMASLLYRTRGGQKVPAIIRTRGHRLEGIWHAGSPMGMIVHALRGMHVCVPRDMTRAVGFYHTLLAGDDPAVVVEVLNGYRLKEDLPTNLHDIKIPLGVPEVMVEGTDLTLVTYGACVRIALEAIELLEEVGISVELIDVQTLLPFDIHGIIGKSLAKTNRLLLMDEDVPGGATAYMLQEIVEKQGAYFQLDSQPKTLTSKAHRPAFGDDGDYWSKPQVEHVFEMAYEIMHEADPNSYPKIM
ncbi:MAG: thiamine pyrophosphate-dependent enzyme [Bacteroidia bacterium]|nr:thiamine pyrophosphate-dependent enzyme [Bacteroidia bacterium]